MSWLYKRNYVSYTSDVSCRDTRSTKWHQLYTSKPSCELFCKSFCTLEPPSGILSSYMVSNRIFSGGPYFALKNTEIRYLSTFKQMLAACICLTNVTSSNHEEVLCLVWSTLFLCVCFKVFLVLYHLIFFQGGGGLSHSRGWIRPWDSTNIATAGALYFEIKEENNTIGDIWPVLTN